MKGNVYAELTDDGTEGCEEAHEGGRGSWPAAAGSRPWPPARSPT